MSHTLYRPSRWYALTCLLLVGALFYLSYGLSNVWAARHMPLPEISFAWERHIPFWAWTIVPYWSLNIFYALGFFLCQSRVALHRYMAQLLLAQVIAVSCFVLWPLQFSWVKPQADGVSGWLFASLAAFDQPYNQAPSLHIILTILVGRFYWNYWSNYSTSWVPWVRMLWAAWLGLIALSVLTTYQHHFIDIPCGLAVGALIAWLFPNEEPYPWQRPIRVTSAHGRWQGLYWGMVVIFAALALQGGAWLWCVWPLLSCVLLAACYSGVGAVGLQKASTGVLQLGAFIILLPYLLVVRLNMAFWLRGQAYFAMVVEDVAVGSVVAVHKFEAVVDVCAEYPVWHPPAHYVVQPMLDMAPPECDDLLRAVRALEDFRVQTQRPVLVCCALGYGRSVAVVVLWLLCYRRAADLASAVGLVRMARPRMVLSDIVCQRIECAWQAFLADQDKG